MKQLTPTHPPDNAQQDSSNHEKQTPNDRHPEATQPQQQPRHNQPQPTMIKPSSCSRQKENACQQIPTAHDTSDSSAAPDGDPKQPEQQHFQPCDGPSQPELADQTEQPGARSDPAPSESTRGKNPKPHDSHQVTKSIVKHPLTCTEQHWCDSVKAAELQRSVHEFMDSRSTTGRSKMDKVKCPIYDSSGRACDHEITSIGDLMSHLKLKHQGAPANAITSWLAKLGLASKCDRCHSMLTTRGMNIHQARCTISTPHAATQPNQIAQPQTAQWKWELLNLDTMQRLCQPGVRCSDHIHPHVVNKVADICVRIRNSSVSRSQQLFATILLLQTVTNHTRYANKRVWKATELKRLWHFEHGDWNKIIQNICDKAKAHRDQVQLNDEVDNINAEVRKGHSRTAVFRKTRIVRPTFDQLHQRVMPQTRTVSPPPHPAPDTGFTDKEDEDPAQQPSSSTTDTQQPHENNTISKKCLETAIKHVGTAKHVTGIAASVWGQIYKAEPSIVIQLVQEIVTNKIPDDVRKILTGVHYNVLAYDATDKLRPVGSLDAITKIAQVYMLEVHHLDVTRVSGNTVDHAIHTEHGMAKLTTTLKAKIAHAISNQNQDFALLQVDVASAFPNSNRQHMRDAVKQWLPQFIDIYDLLYGAPNHHTFVTSDKGVQTVQQRQGIIQGCELSSMFFMLLTHAPMTNSEGKLDDTIANHVLKYADDIYIYGTTDQVHQIYHRLRVTFEQIGFSFNPDKSKLYLPAVTDPQTINRLKTAWQQIEIVREGLTCLGVPLGNQPWTRTQLDNHLEKTHDNLRFCANRCAAQVTLSILQHTASSFQHIISVLPPEETESFAAQVDKITAETFHKCLLGDCQLDQFDDRDLQTLNLRIKMRLRDGGFGVLSLEDRTRYAFVSTVLKIKRDSTNDHDPKSQRAAKAFAHSTSLTNSFQHALNHVATKHDPDVTIIKDLTKMTMSQLIQPVYEHYVYQAQKHLSNEHLQAWYATRHKGANDVITVRPNREETNLTDFQLRYAVFQRLGMLSKMLDIDSHTTPDHKCHGCNHPNITAAHFSSCGHTRKAKHDLVAKYHCAVLDAAGIPSRYELQVPGAQRKIDIFYRDPNPLTTTNNIMADVTIVQAYDPDQTTLPNTSKLLATAAKIKTNKYRNDAAAWRARVQPLPYTTFGAISKDAQEWLDQVERAAMAGGQYFPEIDRRFRVVWRENISFEIARHTADAAEKALTHHKNLIALTGNIA